MAAALFRKWYLIVAPSGSNQSSGRAAGEKTQGVFALTWRIRSSRVLPNLLSRRARLNPVSAGLLDQMDGVVLLPALTTERQWEQQTRSGRSGTNFCGCVVLYRLVLSFDACIDRVTTADELVQSEREHGESGVRLTHTVAGEKLLLRCSARTRVRHAG